MCTCLARCRQLLVMLSAGDMHHGLDGFRDRARLCSGLRRVQLLTNGQRPSSLVGGSHVLPAASSDAGRVGAAAQLADMPGLTAW